MPENEVVEVDEYVGPTCLYKAGESETFEGGDVAIAMAEGWKDSPEKDQEPQPDTPGNETDTSEALEAAKKQPEVKETT